MWRPFSSKSFFISNILTITLLYLDTSSVTPNVLYLFSKNILLIFLRCIHVVQLRVHFLILSIRFVDGVVEFVVCVLKKLRCVLVASRFCMLCVTHCFAMCRT